MEDRYKEAAIVASSALFFRLWDIPDRQAGVLRSNLPPKRGYNADAESNPPNEAYQREKISVQRNEVVSRTGRTLKPSGAKWYSEVFQ